ncbi:MAG: isoprenyl transferase [Alphaproteobacteria bacterium]|nr:isoprenyl transferase [Alphaproteobacteria bacterium]
MDGNGRWASKRGLPRSVGHKKGAEVVKEITKAVAEKGIKYLTLYAFSTENWQRSAEEVSFLMSLLRQYLKTDLQELKENQVRVRFIGERYMLDNDIQQMMRNLENETAHFDKLTVCIALSYGSRQEIIAATKKIAQSVKNGDILIEDIDINLFSAMLYTKDIPEPDLLIRTSGEKRLSNYLLWQLAYSELEFTDVYWPDFTPEELQRLIDNYNTRERRYGKV